MSSYVATGLSHGWGQVDRDSDRQSYVHDLPLILSAKTALLNDALDQQPKHLIGDPCPDAAESQIAGWFRYISLALRIIRILQ